MCKNRRRKMKNFLREYNDNPYAVVLAAIIAMGAVISFAILAWIVSVCIS